MKQVLRLIRSQLGRHKKAVIVRIAIAALIASTPYAFSFLGKWLVDEALQVTGPPEAADQSIQQEEKPAGAFGVSVEWKEQTAEQKVRLLLIFLAVSLGLHVVTTALGAWSELINSRTVQEMTYDLRNKVHEKLESADMQFFSREQVGQLMTRVLDDAASIPGNLTNLVINTSTQVLMLVLGVVLLIRLDPKMTLVAVAALPFYAVTCVLFLPRLRKNTEALRMGLSGLNGYLVERLGSVSTIKNYAQEERETKQFGSLVDRQVARNRLQNRLNVGFNTLTTLITGLATLIVLAMGFLNLRAGKMQLGEVMAFYQVTAQLFVPISALVAMTTVLQTLQVFAERIFGVLDAKREITDHAELIDVPEVGSSILFEGVSLRYHEGGPFAVRDVSFEIPSGATVCIVGPTGCGKSTLLVLLTRLYDPTEGKIRIGGVNTRRIPLRKLRHAVGNVLHDAHVFTGTIAENIAYGDPDATREEIEAAAHVVELHDFVMGQPKGYQTPIGRGGGQLDEEHLIKLNLARAIVTNPAILTVDDTYAGLEEEIEERLRIAVRGALKDKTILIATSRLSICEDADLVAVMEQGQVAQLGTHTELLAVPGLYRRMYMRQMGIEKLEEAVRVAADHRSTDRAERGKRKV